MSRHDKRKLTPEEMQQQLNELKPFANTTEEAEGEAWENAKHFWQKKDKQGKQKK